MLEKFVCCSNFVNCLMLVCFNRNWFEMVTGVQLGNTAQLGPAFPFEFTEI